MKPTRPFAAPLGVLLAGGLALATARCGLDDLTGSGVNPDDVAFALEGDSVVVLGAGMALSPVLPERRAEGPFQVMWSSSAPEVAPVDTAGSVSGLDVGRAEISARLSAPELTEDIVRTWSVRVRYASLAVPAPDSLTGLGETRTLVAHGTDAGGTPDAVVPASFATDDTHIVTVSPAGVVTARGDGTATVTASYQGLEVPVSVPVRRVASRIAFGVSQLILTSLGRDTTVQVIVRDTRDSIIASPALTWESSDPTAITVTPEGVISAVRAATASITASRDTVLATLPVLVGQEAASLSIFAGNNQQAEVGTAVPVAPAVIARDAGGSPLADVPVVFALAAGGGVIADSVRLTDASGVARLGSWTLGTTAGVNALSAEAGSHSLAFTATAVAGPADAGESFVTVSSEVVVANETITLTVHGRDRYGNDVTMGGAGVTFAASGGTSTGVLGGVVDQGNGDYTATFTGVVAGTPTSIGATVDGNPVTTPAPTVTVVPGPPAQVEVVTGNGQTATAGTAVSVPPEVVVRDAVNNAVPGATVTFAVTGGAGSVTGASATTNAQGRAAVGSWTLGTAAGANELTATAGGVSTTFDATGVPGPASPATSTVSLPVSTLIAGDITTVTLTTRDQYGNLRTAGGHTVAFTISGGGSGGNFGSVTDHGDGTYTATFTGITAGTPSAVGATIESVALTTTLPTMEVMPAAASTATSQVTASPTSVPSTGSSTITLRVTDQFGNDLTTGGLTVTFSASQGSMGAVTDHGDGTYTATFNAPFVLLPTSATIRAFIDGMQVTDTATVSVTVL